MYKRQVAVGLVFTLLSAIAAAVVANIDPFHTDMVWLNWIALASIGTVGAFGAAATAVIVAEDSPDDYDKEYFLLLGAISFAYLFIGVFIAGMVADSVEKIFDSLVWSAYAAGLIVYLVTGLVCYLADNSQS